MTASDDTRTATATSPATTTNDSRQPSTDAATTPISNGQTMPPRLTATSPSAMATVRRVPCTSASTAHRRTSAAVASRLTRSAAATLIASASP